jgi:hypothetical protein
MNATGPVERTYAAAPFESPRYATTSFVQYPWY